MQQSHSMVCWSKQFWETLLLKRRAPWLLRWSGPWHMRKAFIRSFIQQQFTEHLLCTRHCASVEHPEFSALQSIGSTGGHRHLSSSRTDIKLLIKAMKMYNVLYVERKWGFCGQRVTQLLWRSSIELSSEGELTVNWVKDEGTFRAGQGHALRSWIRKEEPFTGLKEMRTQGSFILNLKSRWQWGGESGVDLESVKAFQITSGRGTGLLQFHWVEAKENYFNLKWGRTSWVNGLKAVSSCLQSCLSVS